MTACVGDAESLGYRDGALGQRSCAASQLGDAHVAYQAGWDEGVQRFCTEESGYQQGCQGAAFSNVCPDTLAATYLDGYQSGYATYLSQLEVDAIERTIEAKSNELLRIWSELDAVASNLEQSDIHSASRSHWLNQSHALMTHQAEIRAEIDALESEVGARKAQLAQLRHSIAINY